MLIAMSQEVLQARQYLIIIVVVVKIIIIIIIIIIIDTVRFVSPFQRRKKVEHTHRETAGLNAISRPSRNWKRFAKNRRVINAQPRLPDESPSS